MSEIRWDVAEVLDYDYTYRYIPPSSGSAGNTNNLFSIKVRTATGFYNNEVFDVRPSNINLKQIPLVGEFVLIYKTFNEYTSKSRRREGWYYVTTIDVHSNINENLLPGITGNLTDTEIANIKPGKTFKSKAVSPLQPYEGDFLLEGRHGNSIRFGSSINTTYPEKYYHAGPTWFSPVSDNDGDPIIILSNGRNNLTNKEFVIENIEQDASSLYLTSTQKISISLGDTNNKNPLSCYLPAETQFDKSQFIGIADRVILKAKTDIAIIDSPKAIILNTTGEIKLGSDTADQSMVHGDVLLHVLQKILNQLNTTIQCGTMSGTFLNRSNIDSAQRDLQNLLSQKYYINKT